jgi:hypothetical protein
MHIEAHEGAHNMRGVLRVATPAADTFEERVRCCVRAALEAEANGEAVVLAECRHRLEELKAFAPS